MGKSTKKVNRGSKISQSLFSETIKYALSFLLGAALCTSILVFFKFEGQYHTLRQQPHTTSDSLISSVTISKRDTFLSGKSILVAIASFDFSQIPHLEEVLDGFRDVCEAGAKVDVVIYSTEPYPVPFIDMLNSRLKCTNSENFSITISLHSPALRLHLVDIHRTLFYEKLDEYDVFVYTEDDIRVRPTTIAAYLQETERVINLVGVQKSTNFNVGVVRYEYNFPPDVIIDDKTRHATRNVTRVYWEHVDKPIVEKAIKGVEDKVLKPFYIAMNNHHQGMFIATKMLLEAWKREGCNFDVIRDRPGAKNNPSQPSQGTQRVWMSSHMLHGSQHCNVQQLLPMNDFGALTVLHLPNKNYRRVGKKGRIGGRSENAPVNEFGTGEEKFRGPDPSLLTAMQVHMAINNHYLQKGTGRSEYKGIMMVNDIESFPFRNKETHMALVEKTMRQFEAYVARGGVLIESDLETL